MFVVCFSLMHIKLMSLPCAIFYALDKVFSHIQMCLKSQIQLPLKKMSPHLEIVSTLYIQHVNVMLKFSRFLKSFAIFK
jgi:hypothetical protein